jgi:hypothetical protein
LITGALALILVPWSFVYADKPVEERRSVDPNGSVEIVNVSGSIELSAWDRPEIEVTGTVGDGADHIDLSTTGSRTSIHVAQRSGVGWGGGSGETHLKIRVPAKSAVSATVISASLKVSGVQGDVSLRTVNGDISGDVGGNLRANTVNGTIRMAARGARMIEMKTINGDLQLTGGSGDIEVTTVSGNAKVELGTVTRVRFKSISGDVTASLALAPDAQLDAESVSGTLRFDFPTAPTADFDIQTFSGRIENCFGPPPSESHYGPGSRLMFKTGDGHAHVRVETKSGDVRLCAEGPRHAAEGAVRREPVSTPPTVRCRQWTDLLYVL